MAVKLTPQQFAQWARRAAKAIDTNKLELLAAQNASGMIKRRIFNNGRDIHDRPLRSTKTKSPRGRAYSRSYMKTRREAGRQSRKVDLEFTGDMRRGLQVGDSDGPAFGFINDTEAEKGDNMEALYATDIFAVSDSELKKIEKAQLKAAEKMIDKVI